MSTANLGLDCRALPLWLQATNLLCHAFAILVVDRLIDVLVHKLAPLLGHLHALLVDDLLLTDLLHLLAVGFGDLVAVRHRHALRLVAFAKREQINRDTNIKTGTRSSEINVAPEF